MLNSLYLISGGSERVERLLVQAFPDHLFEDQEDGAGEPSTMIRIPQARECES